MDRWQSSSLPYSESSPIWWISRDSQEPILLAASIGIAVLLVVVLFSRIQPKDSHRPPPWPIIGNQNLLSLGAHLHFLKLKKIYGPTFYLRLGSTDCVADSSPQISEGILKTHDVAFGFRTMSSQTEILFYGGQTVVTAPYGPFWRHARKVFTLEILTNKFIQQLQIVRREEILSALFSMIEVGLDGKAAGLFQKLKHLLLNSFIGMKLNKSYFGPHFSVIDKKEVTEMAESSKELIKFGGSLIVGYSKKQNVRVRDMLDVPLTRPTGKEEEPFTDAKIKGLQLIVVLAGTDTSSENEEWAMTQLLKNPHIMKMAQDELDAVVGRDRLVEEAGIPNLRYFRLIVKVIYRLHPVTRLRLPIGCVESREIAVYYIAVNTQVFINIYAIQRDPEVWARPLEFDPERFLSTKIDFHGRDFELVPFSEGRRSCPGKALAMVLVGYMLAVLLHACSWSLPPGVNPVDADMAKAPGVGCQKSNSLQAIASPRLPMDVIYTHHLETPLHL